jgi:hypothetical protein
MTNQPKWRKVANLGDVNPIDYGGLFVYRDTTGVYTEEAERLEAPDSDDTDQHGPWIVHRFCLDRCQIIRETDGNTDTIYLVPARYTADWPHPVHAYDQWFHQDLDKVASFIGTDLETLRGWFCSADPLERALAYQAIGDYHGFENLDSYPLTFHKRSEVTRRYRRWLT